LPSRQPDTRSPSFPILGLSLSLRFKARWCGPTPFFFKEGEGRSLSRHFKTVQRAAENSMTDIVN